MKKLLLATLLIFSTSSTLAQDTKKDFSKMSEDELLAQIMQMEQRKKDAKAKTQKKRDKLKEKKELNKSLNKLSNTLKGKN